MKILRNLFYRYLRQNSNKTIQQGVVEEYKLLANLQENIISINEFLGDSDDIVIRKFNIGIDRGEAFLLYVDGLADKTFIAENLMKSLTVLFPMSEYCLSDSKSMWKLVKESLLTGGDVKETRDFNRVFQGVLSGNTALFIEGMDKAFIISTRGFAARGVEEPDTEAVVRGPREGFVESLGNNKALIRRKIKNPNLRFETMIIGKQTKTDVTLVYIKDICNKKIIAEAKSRLTRINTDAILESGYIESFIEDAPFSPFATIGNTEKPDIVAAKILEGRLAILVDGTPIVLTVPYLFVEGFQSSEDYYSRPYYVTIVRWIRFLAFFLTVYSPSLYIALSTFHQEMIPTPLLISMAGATEGTPFPAFVEVVGMGVTYEILREAGVRMPRPIGQAVSIVGALIVGEAAVNAGIIGAPVVIFTAMTAISSFIIPSKADATIVMRVILTTLAAIAGFYGIILGTMVFLIHLVSLRSYGIPYLSPLAPLTLSELKDVIIRAPLWAMIARPETLENTNRYRQGSKLKPLLHQDEDK